MKYYVDYAILKIDADVCILGDNQSILIKNGGRNMKVNVLRNDKKNVHNGMAMIVQIVMEDFFGKRDLLLDKDQAGFTYLTFEIATEEDLKGFKNKLSKLNPLYEVNINS